MTLKDSFRSPGRRGFNLRHKQAVYLILQKAKVCSVQTVLGSRPLDLQAHPAVVGIVGKAFPAEGFLLFIWLQEERLGYVHYTIHLSEQASRKYKDTLPDVILLLSFQYFYRLPGKTKFVCSSSKQTDKMFLYGLLLIQTKYIFYWASWISWKMLHHKSENTYEGLTSTTLKAALKLYYYFMIIVHKSCHKLN